MKRPHASRINRSLHGFFLRHLESIETHQKVITWSLYLSTSNVNVIVHRFNCYKNVLIEIQQTVISVYWWSKQKKKLHYVKALYIVADHKVISGRAKKH
uniref:Uncharacterized protein n=1 Tax=Parascaris equorum TaxID=6256 RepID=A0A914S4F2_PAREQ